MRHGAAAIRLRGRGRVCIPARGADSNSIGMLKGCENSRTGCQPVQGEGGNALAARCTTAGSPTRTGCQPVRKEGSERASSAFYYELPAAMQTASDHFFSRFAEATVHTRNLPHWAANSTLIFITYRLADSMSADKLRAWQGERDEWLRSHPEPWDDATAREYYDSFPVKLDEMLDAGYGSCVLVREDCRRIVVENLLHFDGERYALHSFVVMPNHVHVLVEIEKRDDLPKIVHSWKSYTAKRINEAIGGSGGVWQREYYDRLIRDAAHYANTVEYIRKNARAAVGINALAARCTTDGSPRRTGCQPVRGVEGNALAARCTTDGSPRRTGCQPVQGVEGNALAARCTTAGSPSRTGCQPVQDDDLKGTR